MPDRLQRGRSATVAHVAGPVHVRRQGAQGPAAPRTGHTRVSTVLDTLGRWGSIQRHSQKFDHDERPKCEMKLVLTGEEQAVVGCPIVGDGADEMLQGFAVAIRMGATLKDLSGDRSDSSNQCRGTGDHAVTQSNSCRCLPPRSPPHRFTIALREATAGVEFGWVDQAFRALEEPQLLRDQAPMERWIALATSVVGVTTIMPRVLPSTSSAQSVLPQWLSGSLFERLASLRTGSRIPAR